MSSNKRGVIRFLVWIGAVGAVIWLLPISLREAPQPSREAFQKKPPEPKHSVWFHVDVKPTAPWRARLASLEDTLRHLVSHRAEKAERAATANFDLPDLSRVSPLLDYAPPKGWLGEMVLADPAPLELATLLGEDRDGFMRALASFKAGDFAAGDFASTSIKASLPVTAAQWAGLRLHPREAGFTRLTRFLSGHPNWPAADWLRRRAEEALFGDKHSDKAIKAFFADSNPSTPAGKLALARALVHDGDLAAAGELVIEVWREDDINGTLESAIKKDFGAFLTAQDHKYRADRLLYRANNGAALRAAQLAGKDVVALARARAAANAETANEKMLSKVPAALQRDPGLLFARIHMLRVKGKIAEAGALMRTAPQEPERIVDGDAWWKERRLLARKLLDKGDAETAYAVCAKHSAHSVSSKVEAEFLAGWIALRFLNDPAKAQSHFELLDNFAQTPIQKARAEYWLGRTAESNPAPEYQDKARRYFQQGAEHSTTFYGQLARAKIGAAESPLRPAPSPAEGDSRDEAVRAVELLLAAGEKEIAAPLAFDAAKKLDGQSQLAALADVAARYRNAKISLVIGKLASNRGVPIDDAAFPGYGVPRFTALPGSAPVSIVYAVARQESAFDPKAVSSAGAMGLMQMIASTARHTASMAGVGYDQRRMISEPAFNAQLGASHLGVLLGEHKGSYILTFAAYNAGGRRVKEWIDAYGDPRKPNVDPIDWVERIPFAETRNYVQHVMENLVVYRAKFGDIAGKPPNVELANAGSQFVKRSELER